MFRCTSDEEGLVASGARATTATQKIQINCRYSRRKKIHLQPRPKPSQLPLLSMHVSLGQLQETAISSNELLMTDSAAKEYFTDIDLQGRDVRKQKSMQLPSGLPVKIEIKLFHVLNAIVAFGNVFAIGAPVINVNHIKKSKERTTCIIEDLCFDVPSEYVRLGSDFHLQITFEVEDELM
ncbi:ankyrin repeat domain-containing protein 13A-like [Toxorhynchites rutilus septentrionalis]|uniref:ankyrin repeat domain-containing protein 13A-like n=1 Tax=Toxorhynchites rutilus septentrionalis TaxID=329112 RepID=UPI00247ABDF3|nr:ankyrin repeat domain-containing protein 13A-like [Toxorhynchites rutilus septentrionalis]